MGTEAFLLGISMLYACQLGSLHAADPCLRTMVACDAPDRTVSLSLYAIVGPAAFLR